MRADSRVVGFHKISYKLSFESRLLQDYVHVCVRVREGGCVMRVRGRVCVRVCFFAIYNLIRFSIKV